MWCKCQPDGRMPGSTPPPPPSRCVARDGWVCCNTLYQRASFRVCVHLLKHGDAQTRYRSHLHTSFTWQHLIPAHWRTPSPPTTLRSRTGECEFPAQGFLLQGSLEYIYIKKKKSHLAAESCVPDVYVSCSRLTNKQTAISFNWD